MELIGPRRQQVRAGMVVGGASDCAHTDPDSGGKIAPGDRGVLGTNTVFGAIEWVEFCEDVMNQSYYTYFMNKFYSLYG